MRCLHAEPGHIMALKFLPMCVQVVQSLSEEQRAELTPLQLRRKAREFALKTMKSQRSQFQR